MFNWRLISRKNNSGSRRVDAGLSFLQLIFYRDHVEDPAVSSHLEYLQKTFDHLLAEVKGGPTTPLSMVEGLNFLQSIESSCREQPGLSASQQKFLSFLQESLNSLAENFEKKRLFTTADKYSMELKAKFFNKQGKLILKDLSPEAANQIIALKGALIYGYQFKRGEYLTKKNFFKLLKVYNEQYDFGSFQERRYEYNIGGHIYPDNDFVFPEY